MVEGGAPVPPAPPGAAGVEVALGHPGMEELVGVALGHPGAEGLVGVRCLWAGGVRGAPGGQAQPLAEVGGAEEGGAGGLRVLVGEMRLEPELELEHLQEKEDVGETVAQQDTVPRPHPLRRRPTLCPGAQPRAPTSISVPGVPTEKGTSRLLPPRPPPPPHPWYLCRCRWWRWWCWWRQRWWRLRWPLR